MKVSYEWLQELVDLKGSLEESAGQLTQLGFPVEGIHKTGIEIDNIIKTTKNKLLNIRNNIIKIIKTK